MAITEATTGAVPAADDLAERVAELSETLSRLVGAVVDVQHRLSRLDGEGLQWPADTMPPRHTKPLGEGPEPIGQLHERVDRLSEKTQEMLDELRNQF
jgi:hypothetical protein